MTFEARLREAIQPLADAHARPIAPTDEAATVVALRAPFALRRFADIVAMLGTEGFDAGERAIRARWDGAGGYQSVELATPGMRVTLAVDGADAVLAWHAGMEDDRLAITARTADTVLDSMLLDALTAFVRGHVPTPPDGPDTD
jgi:hypothetical protein